MVALAARMEASGDQWMAGNAYREAVTAYERAYELVPSDALGRKLAQARAQAGIRPPPSAPHPAAAPPPAPSGSAPPVPVVIEAQHPAETPAGATPADKPKEEEHFRRNWYGYQTLLIDAGALILLVSAIAPANSNNGGLESALIDLSATTYIVGGPVVHLLHGRYAMSGIDLAVRAGAPLVLGVLGAAIGAAAGGSSNNSNGGFFSPAETGAIVGGVLGFSGGIVGAIVVDASVLAVDKTPLSKPTSSFRWMPRIAPIRGGANVGIGGTF
jgi:hypothetical protein